MNFARQTAFHLKQIVFPETSSRSSSASSTATKALVAGVVVVAAAGTSSPEGAVAKALSREVEMTTAD